MSAANKVIPLYQSPFSRRVWSLSTNHRFLGVCGASEQPATQPRRLTKTNTEKNTDQTIYMNDAHLRRTGALRTDVQIAMLSGFTVQFHTRMES